MTGRLVSLAAALDAAAHHELTLACCRSVICMSTRRRLKCSSIMVTLHLINYVVTVSRSPSQAGRLAQLRLVAAACPTLAPDLLLHLRIAYFSDEDFLPNGSSCSLAQRN